MNTKISENRYHNTSTSGIKRALACFVLFAVLLGSVLIPNGVMSLAAGGNNTPEMIPYEDYSLYYSDSYFEHPATEYDSHLATLSMIMTDCSWAKGHPTSTDDMEWYNSQPQRLEKFFEAIGFDDFEANEDYKARTGFDTIGVGAAMRKLDDCTVIGIGIRSGSYYREWSSNVYVGDGTKSDYMHEGFYNAANKLLNFLDGYVSDNEITGKIKLWIAGFSRGGATANITAGLLDNKIDRGEDIFSNGTKVDHDDLYTYTFEAPQGANYNSTTVKKPGDALYNNIWNVINPNDLVPKVPMKEYGFTRFGTDKYITTKFFDPEGFDKNRETFLTLYEKNGHNRSDYKADNFEMYGTFGKDDTKANYDPNIATTILLEEMTKNVGSREDYCRKLQDGLSDFLLALMNDVSNQKEEDILTKVSNIIMTGIAKKSDDSAIREKLEQEISSEDVNGSVIDMIMPLINVMAKVYWERPNELISTGKFISEIIQNHLFEVNVSHLEAQDSYYIDQYNLSNIVDLRNNADFGRLSFFGFNDLKLVTDTDKGEETVADITGSKLGKSKLNSCANGYAAGYYSYITEEKMEAFVPVNKRYNVTMQSFSKKLLHEISLTATYYHGGSTPSGSATEVVKTYSDEVAFSSDPVECEVNMSL